MGAVILGSCLTSFCISIKGHSGLIFGKDDPLPTKEPQTLTVPEPDADKAKEIDGEEETA